MFLFLLGMLTLTVTNPVWVVKTRLCLPNTVSVPTYMHYAGLCDGLKKLYRIEGVRGLYRGFVPGLWGTSHGAIQFMLYEELKKSYAGYKSISIDTKLVSGCYCHYCSVCVNIVGPYCVYINGCW